jgi:hypothetical protein
MAKLAWSVYLLSAFVAYFAAESGSHALAAISIAMAFIAGREI